MEPTHIKKCVNANSAYFMAFNQKNLDALKHMYFGHITLTDWMGNWIGLDAVLLENSNFFKNEFNLVVNSTTVDIDNNMNMVKTINDITIEIDGNTIDVIDEILYTNNGKIYSITATKK
jgi:hypothetical protein